jgi:hypothetical protein
MRVNYRFTFEFDVTKPISVKGTAEAKSMATCFARAARDAVKQEPGLRWSSCVCVIDRTDMPQNDNEESEE